MTHLNMYKVEYTDENGARRVVRYAAAHIDAVSDHMIGEADVEITSLGRLNVLQ